MKKMLSLLLSLILVMSTFAPMNCVIASAASQIEVNRATDDLAEMLSEDEKLLSEDKSTVVNRRIILKTDGKNVDTYNSTMSVDMYGYTIVQYENIESASVAFSRFDALGYEPLYDKISVFNEVDEETSDYELDSYSYSKYRDEKYEWGYAMCDIDEAVDYYKYKVNREVVVGVIDSGIQYDINLFKNRVVRSNTDFSVKASRDEMDDFGHGTQVASAVVMCTPSNVKVQGFKVSNDNKITDSSVLLALSYIKNMSKRPDVINMSFSGTDMDSHIENEINELTAMGVVFVGSAGNDGVENVTFPASYDNVIAVSGVDKDNTPSSFSNYGNCIDIAAPGRFTTYKATRNSPSPKYLYSSGTSFSAPIVAAAAAIVRMEHSNYSPYDVKKRLLESCIPFKEKDCFKKYGKGVVNFTNLIDGTRCKIVNANYQSGVYPSEISVKLECANTLVDIIYTTDGTLPTLKNGNKYTEPVVISENTRLIAVAYERTGSVFHGKFFCADYYIGEQEFITDANGAVVAYLGGKKDVAVPDKINGIAPSSVAENCFRYCDVCNVSLPKSVKNIGDFAFADCNAVAGDFSAQGVRTVGKNAFEHSGFNTVILENCTKVEENAFENAKLQTVKLGRLTKIENSTFKNCKMLQTAYLPKLLECSSTAASPFENCTSLKTLFVPKATSLHLDIQSEVNLYVNNNLSIDFDAKGDYKYNFIAQLQNGISKLREFLEKHSFAHCTYKDSGNFANTKGAQIRATDSGMRFGFNWSRIDELENLANNVEYGFVLNYGDTDMLDIDNAQRKIKAEKTLKDDNKTSFNLVIKDVPVNQRDTVVSVRAYVNVDGWYFYSPIVKRSYNQVATAVLGDEEVDDTVKLSVSEVMAQAE